jgi:hypothetical protein
VSKERIATALKKLVINKHSTLFCHSFSDKEKSVSAIKLFVLVKNTNTNKLEFLSLAGLLG